MKRARILGVATLAIIVLTALVGVASASALKFNSSSSPVQLYAEDNGKHQFTIDEVTITCHRTLFEKKSLATPATTIPTVAVVYNKCLTWFEGLAVIVNMGDCTFEYQQPNAEATSLLALRCTGPKNVNMNYGLFGAQCSISIREIGNTNLAHVKWANNNPTAGKLLGTAEITNITATKNVDNLNCPLNGTGQVNNATYSGLIPFEAPEGINLAVS